MWIKHIYEYSKLIETSTVWKSRIVQNEVCTREKHLSFNIKKHCAKNALCFPDVYARQDFHSRILMRDSSGLEDFKDIQVRVVLATPEFILEHFGNDPFSSRIRIKRQQLFAATPYNKLNKFIRIGLSEHRTRFAILHTRSVWSGSRPSFLIPSANCSSAKTNTTGSLSINP